MTTHDNKTKMLEMICHLAALSYTLVEAFFLDARMSDSEKTVCCQSLLRRTDVGENIDDT